jgi:hypothetical protein
VLRCLSAQSTKVLRATHELTVYVSTNSDGTSDGLHIRLFHQHFSCLQRDRLSARISDKALTTRQELKRRIGQSLIIPQYPTRPAYPPSSSSIIPPLPTPCLLHT